VRWHFADTEKSVQKRFFHKLTNFSMHLKAPPNRAYKKARDNLQPHSTSRGLGSAKTQNPPRVIHLLIKILTVARIYSYSLNVGGALPRDL
jgi:hypothetical protein